MKSRAIIDVAYKSRIVPEHLYGRTQHKTLGARLSEDILVKQERSRFFRPASGTFFLREFLDDVTIAEEFRQPIPVKRRFRELKPDRALAIKGSTLDEILAGSQHVSRFSIMRVIREGAYFYADPRREIDSAVFIHAFACVFREQSLLTYSLGRYREDRVDFLGRRCVGFTSYVTEHCATLFNLASDVGISDAAADAVVADLDIPNVRQGAGEVLSQQNLGGVALDSGGGKRAILAVVNIECPAWFEPTKRRLAVNGLSWLPGIEGINDLDRFDPWSQLVIQHHRRAA